MYYISIDVGTKNIGITFYKYNHNFLSDINNKLKTNYKSVQELKQINNKKDILTCLSIIDKVIDIKFFKLVNILNNKKLKDTNIIERSKNLKKELFLIDSLIDNYRIQDQIKTYINVHIEYQMNINYCSLGIMNQFVYHFTNPHKYDIKIISPTYKNKLYFHENIKHRIFLQQYNTNYKANKEHSKYNLLYYIYIFKQYHLLNGINLKKIDDLADSLLQSLTNL